MANLPPLPFGGPLTPPLASRPAGPNGHQQQVQLPQNVRVEHPLPPFPPDLQKQLDEARRVGSYCITISTHAPLPNDPDRITCFMSRSFAFKKDWLLRMWQTTAGMVLTETMNYLGIGIDKLQAAFSVKPEPPPPPAPTEDISAAG